VQRIAQQIYHVLSDLIRSLPKPVVYSFPYFLFALLSINVILLIWQTRRELKEYRLLQAHLARERAVAKSKRTLMELVSHYLRTPLTVIRGGIDMLAAGAVASSDMWTCRQRLTPSLNIERLLIGCACSTPLFLLLKRQRWQMVVWRQPGLFVPLLLIAAIIIPFDYLAHQAGSLSAGQVTLTAQSIVFFILAVMLYQVLRSLQLRRRDYDYFAPDN